MRRDTKVGHAPQNQLHLWNICNIKDWKQTLESRYFSAESTS